MPAQEPTRLPLPFLKWRGFTLQFFLITILPLTLLLILVTFGSLQMHHTAMRSLVGDRDLRAVRAAASSLEKEFDHRAALIDLLGRGTAGRTSLDYLVAEQGELDANFDGGLALLDASGVVLDTHGPADAWLAEIEEINTGRAAEPAFSQPVTSADGMNWVLVSVQTPDSGSLVGAFSPHRLIQDTLESTIDVGKTTAMVVTMNAGGGVQQLYHNGPAEIPEHLADHPGTLEVLDGQSGIRYYASGHSEHVIAFAPIASTGWGLVIEEAWEDISSPVLRTTQLAPLILVPVLLLALLALWFGASRIVQPLQALENRAFELAKGDFGAIRQPVGGITEIRNLQDQLVDMAGQLDAAQQSLRSYIGAITAGIEGERRSLARDLHDDTIQSLIALNQRIQMAVMSSPEEQKRAVTELQPLVQDTIANLRRTIRGLRPIYLEDLGLVTSLEMLARETAQGTGLAVEFAAAGREQRLDPETEMMVYRMVQESLSNVVRHAEAQRAWVEVAFDTGALHVSVRDDGHGFRVPADRSEFPAHGHFGLLGMHERAELIGADLEIESEPGRGACVRIQVPLSRN